MTLSTVLYSIHSTDKSPFSDSVLPVLSLPYWFFQLYLFMKVSFIIIITIYPLTARVVGAPQMILQPVSSIFPVLLCPLGPGELQACPIPDVVFPPLPLSALSRFPLSLCLARWLLARPDERETSPYHYSLRLFTMVRILARTSPLVTWSLYEMCNILQ